jgi:5-formyltetrahydrofolate cyclo-ligase
MVCNGTGGRRHLIFSPDDPIALRSALRREMRMRRRTMPPFRRQLATRAILRFLRTLPAYRRARHIALYWPADGEPDVRGLADHARLRGKQLYLPVVNHGGAMHFTPWLRATKLRRNRYGIPEPVFARRRVTAARLDLVIVPLVAFDAHGHRLGMGGGYYDRALAGRRQRTFLAGAAFSFQQARNVPVQPWDVPLDIVITESGRRAQRNGRTAQGILFNGAEQ